MRTIVRGEIGDQEAYQIIFDSDIYILGNQEVHSLILEEGVSSMNDILFELYKDVVTEKFLQQLNDGTFDEQIIKGVEKNE